MKSLANLFSRKEDQPLVGIDISSSSIKLVELSKSKSGEYSLEHCGIELLDSGWIVDGSVENFDAVTAALKTLLRTSGTKAKNAALALPQSAVITKKILLPSELTEAEMEVQVEAEANQYIPFPLEEVCLDFYVIGPVAGGDGSDVEVLLAASRKEKVYDYQALAEEVGLIPTVVEVDIFASRLALLNAADHLSTGRGEILALFEIGGSSTTVQILKGNTAVYERELSFGGRQLTDAMVRQYGFTVQEAESKKRLNEVPEDFKTTLLPEFVDSIAAEISRALQLFLSSTVYGRVDRILLAGGTAAVSGLDRQVAKQTGCVTTVLNPFEGMRIGREVRQQRLDKEAPSYLTACGLAMRRFQV